MYVVFFLFEQTGPNCLILNPDPYCSTYDQDGLGTGTVTPVNEGDQCQGSGTCTNGTCIGGK